MSNSNIVQDMFMIYTVLDQVVVVVVGVVVVVVVVVVVIVVVVILFINMISLCKREASFSIAV
jgi:hypothetical protein